MIAVYFFIIIYKFKNIDNKISIKYKYANFHIIVRTFI